MREEIATGNASLARGYAWHAYPDPATPGVFAGDNPFGTQEPPGPDPSAAVKTLCCLSAGGEAEIPIRVDTGVSAAVGARSEIQRVVIGTSDLRSSSPGRRRKVERYRAIATRWAGTTTDAIHRRSEREGA